MEKESAQVTRRAWKGPWGWWGPGLFEELEVGHWDAESRGACMGVLPPSRATGGNQRCTWERLLELPSGDPASGEARGYSLPSHQGEDGRAWQEVARFRAVWSKINLAWVDLLWGARVWARSRDPESLACRLDSNTSCTRRTWDSQGLGKQHKGKSDIFSLWLLYIKYIKTSKEWCNKYLLTST